mmetsp:Transcript_20858/g.35139  ORF Transcript_20858/g.35139 Transcript_20858/m.35139 type:complete len:236 (+) Transcript_20858:265-972(+)
MNLNFLFSIRNIQFKTRHLVVASISLTSSRGNILGLRVFLALAVLHGLKILEGSQIIQSSGADLEPSEHGNSSRHPTEVGNSSHFSEQAHLQSEARTRSIHEKHGIVVGQKLSRELSKTQHIQSSGQTELDHDEPQGGVDTELLNIGKDGALVDQENHKNDEKLTANQEATDVLLVGGSLHQGSGSGVSLRVVVLLRVLVLSHQDAHLQTLKQGQEQDAARENNKHYHAWHATLR